MHTADEIANSLAPEMFRRMEQSRDVRDLLFIAGMNQDIHRAGHVIDAAGFDTARGRISFDGEFDFHAGRDGDKPGHNAVRINIAGHLVLSQDVWVVESFFIESLDRVDSGDDPTELDDSHLRF